MSRASWLLLVAATTSAATAAAASAETLDADLRLRDLPDAPVRLQMRADAPARRGPSLARLAQRPTTPARGAGSPEAGPTAGTKASVDAIVASAPTERDVRVMARLDAGYAVDGGSLVDRDRSLELSPRRPTLAGADLRTTPYRGVRGYGLGNVYLGSEGAGLPSLSTYLAAQARFAPSKDVVPLPSVYDAATDVQVRAAWAESDDMFESRWLKPLRVRAGRQFVYGPAIAHLDGLLLGWETKGIELHLYTGSRVADYYASEGTRGHASDIYNGVGARVDLGTWWSVPLVLTAASLDYGSHTHGEISAAYARPSKDLVIRASGRRLDGRWVRERATARVQLSDVTQITVDAEHRSRDDWRWDPEWVTADRTTDYDRYLWLGPVAPRIYGSLRAGTVLADNVDVLLRAAGSMDISRPNERIGAFGASWVEGGTTVEVRLRRAIALSAGGIARFYDRPDISPIIDFEQPDAPGPVCDGVDPTTCPSQPLPPYAPHLGERNMQQGSIRLRYTAGARRFSASAEIYTRRTKFTETYRDDFPQPEDGPQSDDYSRDDLDRRGGGRFTIEAWPTSRVRILAEYDLTTLIEIAPEITGYKHLRLVAEATW